MYIYIYYRCCPPPPVFEMEMDRSVRRGANPQDTAGGESAESIAARLAKDDARRALKPKRTGRELAQGAGMHAAMGLVSDRASDHRAPDDHRNPDHRTPDGQGRAQSHPSTAAPNHRSDGARRVPSAPASRVA